MLYFGMGLASTGVAALAHGIYSNGTAFEKEIVVKDTSMEYNNRLMLFENYIITDENGDKFQMAPILLPHWNSHRMDLWDRLYRDKKYRIKCYGLHNAPFSFYPKVWDVKECDETNN